MSNLTNNRLNVMMTPAQITAVKGALVTIQTNMPFLIGLTIDERVSIPKINVNNKVFTEDAINAAINNSSLLPSYFNVTALQTDLTLFTQIDEVLAAFSQMTERLEDTQMLAGSEAYVGGLTAYKLFLAAAEAGVNGADAICSQLKTRFTNTTKGTNP